MRNIGLYFAVNLLLFQFNIAFSQDSTIIYSLKLDASISNANTPFWLQSNRFGNIPTSGSFVSTQWGTYKIYNPGNPRLLQWSAGAELIGNVSKVNSIFFSDLYIAGKLGIIELSIGHKREVGGIADTCMTSGSLAISGNSRPYPKIKISTPNFIKIIPSIDIVALKFSYSDGLLGSAKIHYGNVTHIPSLFMHQKSLYFRLGGPQYKLSLYAGFNHQAMWGGESKIFTGGLKQPEAYKYMVTGKPWAGSRVGNHLGTIDLGAEWRGKDWEIFVYRQSIYEDGSLKNLSNVADGLNGLRFKRSKIDRNSNSIKFNVILLELINTKNQGGSIFDYNSHIFGKDNYYNHYVYSQGWSYKDRSIGTPLIIPQSMNHAGSNSPTNDSLFTINNRLLGLHLGLNLAWKKVSFLVKSTYSQNFGTYDLPLVPKKNQFSILFRAQRNIPVWKQSVVGVSLSADIGNLYPNASALTVNWYKTGFLR